MQRLKVQMSSKVDGQKSVDGKSTPGKDRNLEIMNVRDLTFDFHAGVARYNFYDEMGPQSGEFPLSEMKDVDWETVQNTAESGPVLNTYQLRAIHNLPPKLPGAPDYTFAPEMPKVLTPTEVKVPPEIGQ